ncbi:hypothetical protein PFICI_04919 [Pestalotiopsis fici W106-1]|uniref:Mid2 domain-containing protein n=1 Tax=Pestalotiopsis fici (strain W106-1 / CGMCC3.15140) TaxID=1229662 RepID=W3XAB2_PESFW|nr:uncharacterized protein PFICI_04919 [Pestalotiopsis fici W106-1]ETS83043.1 hypothetical protein PFICI_04919 [Pestalotiopsis fici W106-1]
MRSSRIIALASWSAGVWGFENKFLFPTDKDLTFHYKNTIEVQYQSNFASPTLYTYCKVNGKSKEENKVTAPKYNATVSVTLNWDDEASECWFNLMPADSKKTGFNSPNSWSYEVGKANTTTVKADDDTTKPSTKPSTSSSTTTSASSTATSTATPTTADAANAQVTTSSQPSATPSSEPLDDDPKSKGIKVGIAVGAAFGGLLVMTIIGMLAARFLRRDRPLKSYKSMAASASEMGLVAGGPHKPAASVSYNPVSQFEPSGAPASAPYDPHRH